MGMVLKYVQKMPSGSWRYRRRVPDELKVTVGKTEFTRHLGDTEKEAGRNWAGADAEYERVIRAAKWQSAGLPTQEPERPTYLQE
jgi:hypothetical protein